MSAVPPTGSCQTGGKDTVKKHVHILTQWCKGCGICEAFCPEGVLEIVRGKAVVRDAARCVGCGICEMRCPDYAIFLSGEEAPHVGD